MIHVMLNNFFYVTDEHHLQKHETNGATYDFLPKQPIFWDCESF